MLEQLYSDFTTKLLPQINEGLIISKDYFADLFGRYIHYLIITDGIKTLIGLIIITACLVAIFKTIKNIKNNWDDFCNSADMPIQAVILIIIALPLFIGSIIFFDSIFNLVKDIYIPEVRIMEIIQGMNSTK